MSLSGPSSSSGVRRRSKIDPSYENYELDNKGPQIVVAEDSSEIVAGEVTENADALQRRLGNRQIQLIAIGGSIGRPRREKHRRLLTSQVPRSSSVLEVD